MAQKALESCVRDMQNLIKGLSAKVEALECKISDQNAVITKQVQIIAELISKMEGTTPTSKSISVQAQPALQRPVRKARLNTIAAAAAVCTGTRKSNNCAAAAQSALKARSPMASPNYLPKTPEVSRTDNLTSTSSDIASTTTITAGVATKATGCLISNTTVKSNTGIPPKQKEDGSWQVVNRRRKLRQVVTGEGKVDDNLRTVDRIRYIQAWSFRPETSKENVLNYLNKIRVCDEYIVEKRVLKTDRHAAFVIGVPESLYDCFYSPTAWPPRVKVSEWFRPRPRGERGSGAGADDCETGPHTSATGQPC